MYINRAIYPPHAKNAAPSNGESNPPSPDAALNMPRFFSRSSLSEYRSKSAYSPTMLAAVEIPIKMELIRLNQKKAVEVVVFVIKPKAM